MNVRSKKNKELESFYRLLKLKAHFKDNEHNKLTTVEQIFQKQEKEEWTPNNSHHAV